MWSQMTLDIYIYHQNSESKKATWKARISVFNCLCMFAFETMHQSFIECHSSATALFIRRKVNKLPKGKMTLYAPYFVVNLLVILLVQFCKYVIDHQLVFRFLLVEPASQFLFPVNIIWHEKMPFLSLSVFCKTRQINVAMRNVAYKCTLHLIILATRF